MSGSRVNETKGRCFAANVNGTRYKEGNLFLETRQAVVRIIAERRSFRCHEVVIPRWSAEELCVARFLATRLAVELCHQRGLLLDETPQRRLYVGQIPSSPQGVDS